MIIFLPHFPHKNSELYTLSGHILFTLVIILRVMKIQIFSTIVWFRMFSAGLLYSSSNTYQYIRSTRTPTATIFKTNELTTLAPRVFDTFEVVNPGLVYDVRGSIYIELLRGQGYNLSYLRAKLGNDINCLIKVIQQGISIILPSL